MCLDERRSKEDRDVIVVFIDFGGVGKGVMERAFRTLEK